MKKEGKNENKVELEIFLIKAPRTRDGGKKTNEFGNKRLTKWTRRVYYRMLKMPPVFNDIFVDKLVTCVWHEDFINSDYGFFLVNYQNARYKMI